MTFNVKQYLLFTTCHARNINIPSASAMHTRCGSSAHQLHTACGAVVNCYLAHGGAVVLEGVQLGAQGADGVGFGAQQASQPVDVSVEAG
jgi:hypothetical protein